MRDNRSGLLLIDLVRFMSVTQ